MIDTVVFDIGQVLADFCWRDLFHELGYEGEKFDRIANATVLGPWWPESDRGVLTPQEIMRHFVEGAPEYKEEIEAIYVYAERLLKLRNYTLPWIRDLKRRGYRVYIISNMPEVLYLKSEKSNFCFLEETDGAIISYKEKMVKPGREIYELLCTRFQIDPAKAVFIDDSEINIQGAKACGIYGLLFQDEQQAKMELEKLLEEN